MRRLALALLVVISALSWMHAADLASAVKNNRLKAVTYKDAPIAGDARFLEVDGIWVSESKDPGKTLATPQQLKIECHNYGNDDRKCVEITVTLAPVKAMVGVQSIDTEEYDVDSWDLNGIVASYGGGEGLSAQCQRHTLTINFASGAVVASDIPIHKKGCEAFTETDSYRLVRGNYYVDTSPNNDFDNPATAGNK